MALQYKDTDDLISILGRMCNSTRIDRLSIAEGIEYILDNDLWQFRNPDLLKEREYNYFPDFVEASSPWGLNTRWDLIKTISEVNARIYHKVTEAGKRGHGGDRKSDKIKVYNVNDESKTKGNSKAYGLSKLNKERPDLFEKVTSDEMSVHAAMVKAGFRRRKIQVEPDPDKLARSIKRHLDEDQIARLIKILMT